VRTRLTAGGPAQIFDEGKSWFAGEADFSGEEHQKNSINGYILGNNDGFRMRVGDRVRWYLFAVGGQTGLHTPHFHAATVLEYGRCLRPHPSPPWSRPHPPDMSTRPPRRRTRALTRARGRAGGRT
jgi:hypothetical protein